MKKLEKTAKSWAVTAHRLTDGAVVYRGARGGWDERLDAAAVHGAREAADAALAAAGQDVADRLVINPYLFEIGAEDRAPASVRERIRAAGPTVRPDLGKQAAPGRPAHP